MPEKQEFGVICQGCGQFLLIGDVESGETVPLEQLRDKLRSEGWVKIVEHSPFGCNFGKPYTPDDVVLRP